jgi:hypothetical protein
MKIEPWYLGPIPTYRIDKYRDRRDIRQQTAYRRQTPTVNRKIMTDISCEEGVEEGGGTVDPNC